MNTPEHTAGLILFALAWGGCVGFAGFLLGTSFGLWTGRQVARREAREVRQHAEAFGREREPSRN